MRKFLGKPGMSYVGKNYPEFLYGNPIRVKSIRLPAPGRRPLPVTHRICENEAEGQFSDVLSSTARTKVSSRTPNKQRRRLGLAPRFTQPVHCELFITRQKLKNGVWGSKGTGLEPKKRHDR